MPYFPSASPDLPPDSRSTITGWARVPPAVAWKSPGLPRGWCPVLESDPSEPGKPPIDGWIFVRQDGKIREIVVQGEEPALQPEREPVRAAGQAMSRVSGEFVWGIRWETLERIDGTPRYGGLVPFGYGSRRQAQTCAWRLSRTHPVRCNPFGGQEASLVGYVVCARREDEPFGL